MMMKKKFVAVALSAVCLLSAVSCGQQSASTASSASSVSSSVASSASASQVMDAEDYLSGISGTYVELFPEMAKSEYRNLWIDAATPLVGEDNAESATDMLLGMCMAEPYGEEAVENMQQIRTARRSTAIFWAAWKIRDEWRHHHRSGCARTGSVCTHLPETGCGQ